MIHLYHLLIILATVVVTVRVFISKHYYMIRTLSSALLNVYHDFVKDYFYYDHGYVLLKTFYSFIHLNVWQNIFINQCVFYHFFQC